MLSLKLTFTRVNLGTYQVYSLFPKFIIFFNFLGLKFDFFAALCFWVVLFCFVSRLLNLNFTVGYWDEFFLFKFYGFFKETIFDAFC